LTPRESISIVLDYINQLNYKIDLLVIG